MNFFLSSIHDHESMRKNILFEKDQLTDEEDRTMIKGDLFFSGEEIQFFVDFFNEKIYYQKSSKLMLRNIHFSTFFNLYFKKNFFII